ncbi:hypothetical protein EX30DRAFT_360754 [Ascodesmis nigricans]|uniref:Peptidyl-prolyl cis-trans isomerase-like 2 n=1 Tax=Ascodesmis nigricans TaxID=341454 RepID=A0A4S2N693_9PEZI|nr:hypothetical protein EX30DRAFT_360754 [Ascodesmis nigricans]
MGKKHDRLYITHSEWASSDSYGAATGYQSKSTLPFKRLPFHICALSLQPFTNPVCTHEGHIFELTHIIPWLKKHGTNPVTGEKLSYNQLIKLHIHRNESGEYCDPVTFKVFTDNTHIVALKTSGNVFAWDTIERLNIKPKVWRDLVDDVEFTRKDIIELQDPQNLRQRDMAAFQYVKEGMSTLTDEQKAERDDPMSGINSSALGTSSSAAKVLAAKAAVAKARAERAAEANKALVNSVTGGGSERSGVKRVNDANKDKEKLAYNAARYTTGKAAASLTSTALTPHTGAERATLTDEEYMLKPKRVKIKGYARIATNVGNINIELYPEYAPKAVWNFVQLSKKGYYKNVKFHRSIKSFMIQGGDPTGTGRGGSSIWNKPFADEFESPLLHNSRGILSMANKGKNTNTSQFFILYQPAPHLDRKHTIFARVVGGLDVLDKMERIPTGEGDRPLEDITIREVVVFVDPFEEFLKNRRELEEKAKREEEVRQRGGEEDDSTTWTGKRIRGGGVESTKGSEVGKYLKMKKEEDAVPFEEELEVGVHEPVKKKAKSSGGFGNFDNW